MTGQSLSFDLTDTITENWHRRLAGADGTRVHWRTKTQYYRATADLLRTRPGRAPSWRDIVAAVLPRGSRSTFYEVTGPASKHALLDNFLSTDRADALQIALTFRRHSAVDQLIDETKVWSYWPARARWLRSCQGRADMTFVRATDALLVALGEWARQEPALAAALDNAPPICAVEDLVRLHGGRLPAIRAIATLRQAMAVAGPAEEAIDPDPGLITEIQSLDQRPARAAVDADIVHETMFVLAADAMGRHG
jgi:hypothetical protein